MSTAMDWNKENIENVGLTVEVESLVSKNIVLNEVTGLPKIIVHDGFPFTCKKVSVNADTALYYCKHNHSCVYKVCIKVKATVGCVMVLADSHTEMCVAKSRRQLSMLNLKKTMYDC